MESLQESERFLSEIFSSIQAGISVLGTDLTLLRVNPVMKKWYAHAMPLVGKKCYEAYHGRTKRCDVCPTKQTLTKCKPAYEVVPKTGPGGKIVGWLDLYSFPLIDATTGKMKGVIEYVRDITKRKNAEAALKESEKKYRFLVENMPDIIYSISARDETITALNRSFERMTGWKRKEWIGKKFISLVHPEDLPLAFKTYRQTLRGETPPPYELRIRTKSGAFRVGEFSSSPQIENDKIVGEFGIVRDITERKRTEEALMQSEEKYRLSYDNIPLHMAVIDATGKFMLWNRHSEKMFGYTTREVVGKMSPLNIHASKEDADMVIRIATSTGAYDGEINLKRKNGELFPARLIVIPYRDFAGKIINYFGFAEDITERKKVEKMREDLIRDVTHELKTPIAMTEMAYNMCGRAIKSGDMAKIRKAHNVALNNIKRIRKDVENVLKAFSLERKKRSVKGRCRLREIVERIIRDLSYINSEKQLKIEVDIPGNADKINMERVDASTILSNMIDNAMKFTEAGSISISSRAAGKWLKITVADTGLGLAPESLDRVFEKFFKGSSSLPGVGLGLPICKEIVKRYKGKIEVFSKGLGRGATVVVSLPRQGGKNEAHSDRRR